MLVIQSQLQKRMFMQTGWLNWGDKEQGLKVASMHYTVAVLKDV